MTNQRVAVNAATGEETITGDGATMSVVGTTAVYRLDAIVALLVSKSVITQGEADSCKS
jgi:hypothetical protein